MARVLLGSGVTDLDDASLGGAGGLNLDTLFIQGGGQAVVSHLDQSGLTNGMLDIDEQASSGVSFLGTAGNPLKCTFLTGMKLGGVSGTMRYQPFATTQTGTVTGISVANPGVVTTGAAHNLTDRQAVTIAGTIGNTPDTVGTFYAKVLSSTTFALYSDANLTTSVNVTAVVDGTGTFSYSVVCPRIQVLNGKNLQLVSGSTAALPLLEMSGTGRCDIDDSTIVQFLSQYSGTIAQQYNATQNVTWRMKGGSFNSERGWSGTGLPTDTGGAAILAGSAVVNIGRNDNNITSLATGGDLIAGSGFFGWRGGNLGKIFAHGGMFDFRYVPAPMTIDYLEVSWAVAQRSYFKSIGATNLVTVTKLRLLDGPQDTLPQ